MVGRRGGARFDSRRSPTRLRAPSAIVTVAAEGKHGLPPEPQGTVPAGAAPVGERPVPEQQ